ncbi:MAG: DUF4097 family beta strand repeat-containing protein [Acidobacteriota bacterium]
MKPTKKTIIVLIVALLAMSSPILASQLASVSKSFQVGTGGKLVVDVSSGDLDITTGAGNVQIDVVGMSQSELPDLDIHQSGSTVYITYKNRGRQGRNIRFELNIPTDFNLDLATAGGDIKINGLLNGAITGHTSGGDISFHDVNGQVDLRTSGGDIQGGAVQGSVDLTTSGGDIELEAANGEVVVKTSGGDIKVGNVGQRLEAKTAGGDIELGNVGGAAEVKTAGGDIVVGSVDGSADLATAGGDIDLKGASGAVDAKTAGGDLELKSVSGPIQARTAGGEIDAELTAVSGSSSLKTAGGDIQLHLPAGAGATIHALIKISGNWERESTEYGIYCDLQPVSPVRDAQAEEIRADIALGGGGPDIYLETVNGNIRISGLNK